MQYLKSKLVCDKCSASNLIVGIEQAGALLRELDALSPLRSLFEPSSAVPNFLQPVHVPSLTA